MQKKFSFLLLITLTFILVSIGKKDKPTYFQELTHYTFGSSNNQTFKMRYFSDQLEIEGYLVRPKNIAKNERLPLIIYNRGGNRDFGAIEFKQLQFMNSLVDHGYIVMASQYRGNLNSEGEDEFGGADVNDIIQLVHLAEKMKFIDPENIGTIGVSRGALMSLILAKKSALFKTHICIGAPTNLFQSIRERPQMYSGVYHPLIGDTITNRAAYVNRSAIFWSNEIKTPLFLLHGTDDINVNISQAMSLADSLNHYNKSFTLKTIEGGNHPLTSHTELRDSLIIAWFDDHLKINP